LSTSRCISSLVCSLGAAFCCCAVAWKAIALPATTIIATVAVRMLLLQVRCPGFLNARTFQRFLVPILYSQKGTSLRSDQCRLLAPLTDIDLFQERHRLATTPSGNGVNP